MLTLELSIALVFSALACALSASAVVTVLRSKRTIEASVRTWVEGAMVDQLETAGGIVAQAEEMLPQLKAWNGRALATIRHAQGAKHDAQLEESADAPAWLKGLAESAGLDADKLAAWDQGEVEKAMAALKKGGFMGGGAGGPQPDYL